MRRRVREAYDTRVIAQCWRRNISATMNRAMSLAACGAACLAALEAIGYKGPVAAARDDMPGGSMYAIVYKSDGFPICRQVAGVSPDPVVTWNTEDAAKAFISAKGGDRDFQPVALTDEAMDKMAVSMGCPVESITFDPYPG
jgi:hypothetical protein